MSVTAANCRICGAIGDQLLCASCLSKIALQLQNFTRVKEHMWRRLRFLLSFVFRVDVESASLRMKYIAALAALVTSFSGGWHAILQTSHVNSKLEKFITVMLWSAATGAAGGLLAGTYAFASPVTFPAVLLIAAKVFIQKKIRQ